jgi:hypothetical protein
MGFNPTSAIEKFLQCIANLDDPLSAIRDRSLSKSVMTAFGTNFPVNIQLMILQCYSFWRTAKKRENERAKLHTNDILVDASQYYR